MTDSSPSSHSSNPEQSMPLFFRLPTTSDLEARMAQHNPKAEVKDWMADYHNICQQVDSLNADTVTPDIFKQRVQPILDSSQAFVNTHIDTLPRVMALSPGLIANSVGYLTCTLQSAFSKANMVGADPVVSARLTQLASFWQGSANNYYQGIMAQTVNQGAQPAQPLTQTSPPPATPSSTAQNSPSKSNMLAIMGVSAAIALSGVGVGYLLHHCHSGSSKHHSTMHQMTQSQANTALSSVQSLPAVPGLLPFDFFASTYGRTMDAANNVASTVNSNVLNRADALTLINGPQDQLQETKQQQYLPFDFDTSSSVVDALAIDPMVNFNNALCDVYIQTTSNAVKKVNGHSQTNQVLVGTELFPPISAVGAENKASAYTQINTALGCLESKGYEPPAVSTDAFGAYVAKALHLHSKPTALELKATLEAIASEGVDTNRFVQMVGFSNDFYDGHQVQFKAKSDPRINYTFANGPVTKPYNQ